MSSTTETLPAKTGASMRRHQSTQEVGTPQRFVELVELKFQIKFDIDLAASASNTKVPTHFITREQNALTLDWHLLSNGPGWLNPEFNDIQPWAAKCEEQGRFHQFRSVMLTPASVGSNWYRDHVHHKAMVIALNGRIQFEGSPDPYPKDLMLSLFGFGFTGFDVWKWK